MPKLVIDVAMGGVKCCLVTLSLHYHGNPSGCLAVPVPSLLKVPKMLSVFSLSWGSCMRIPSLTSDWVMLMLRHAAQLPSHNPPPSFRPAGLMVCVVFLQAIFDRLRSPLLSLFNSAAHYHMIFNLFVLVYCALKSESVDTCGSSVQSM